MTMMVLRYVVAAVVAWWIVGAWSFPTSHGFVSRSARHISSLAARSREQKSPQLDKVPAAFEPFFSSASNATQPRGAMTERGAHDSFRYEWGTWVNGDAIETLMDRVNEIRVADRTVYDSLARVDDNVRLRVAGGDDWDCILHILPPLTSWSGRWPTGSWAIVRTLVGMAGIASLRGPDRDGNYQVKTSRELRGGTDGSIGGGSSSAGADCIKYVGGPLRQYTGKAGKTIVLEVVIRPPGTKIDPVDDLMADIATVLSVVPKPKPTPPEEEAKNQKEGSSKPDAPHRKPSLGSAMGMKFDNVGGLDDQLDDIVRRVLASRANPAASKRLGIKHVRGVLLSGPPGCGKTLLARELARILGSREPQIVNGPEILDKYIGEAERKVRALFAPAEMEYEMVGEQSGLHIIILDEMDAIARKRGTMTSDTTGVRDSVVNQLLAKLDGVKEASNVLVVGLTNRPELLDPALLRPGRLEVQLRVELPDLLGRRDVLRIHTRQMREESGLNPRAIKWMEDLSEAGLAAKTEHFSGAELAGLVRSAASFGLARAVEQGGTDFVAGMVDVPDLQKALEEVRPALGKQDEVLRMRYPLGISPCSSSMTRVMRDLQRFTMPVPATSPRLQSLLVVGGGGIGGAGATAVAAWAASEASSSGAADYVRFVTALDLLSTESGGGDEARAAALMEHFAEAREMPHSLLVLDDVDQLCAGSGPGGYSSIMIATLRALLRSPPASFATAKAGGQSVSKRGGAKSVHIIGATSRSDAACVVLHELFDETIVVQPLSDMQSVEKLLSDSLYPGSVENISEMAKLMIECLGSVGCKTALRLAERTVATAGNSKSGKALAEAQLDALAEILDDLAGDEVTVEKTCDVF